MAGDLNIYAMCVNNPLYLIDPFGLSWKKWAQASLVAVGGGLAVASAICALPVVAVGAGVAGGLLIVGGVLSTGGGAWAILDPDTTEDPALSSCDEKERMTEPPDEPPEPLLIPPPIAYYDPPGVSGGSH